MESLSKECGNSSEKVEMQEILKKRFIAFKLDLAIPWKCNLVLENTEVLG